MSILKTTFLKLEFLFFIFLFSLISCNNLNDFKGKYEGNISQSRLVRRGIDFCSRMILEISKLSSGELEGSFSIIKNPDSSVCSGDVTDDGTTFLLPVENIQLNTDPQYLNDTFSKMSLSGEPLFTHMAHATIPSSSGNLNVVVFLTFYSSKRVVVRLVSSSVYGVFSLDKNK